jgi:hypothetical protein
MERPQQINRFATCAVLASLINFAGTSLLADGAARALIGAAMGVVLILGLVAWTVRGRSAIGRLALTIWLAFGIGASLASYAYLLATHMATIMSPGVQALSLLATVANIVALTFLWSRPATAWLQKQPEPSERP